VFIFFILVNTFIAIINDAYGKSSQEVQGAPLALNIDKSLMDTYYGIRHLVVHRELLLSEFQLLSQLKDFEMFDDPDLSEPKIKQILKDCGIVPHRVYVKMVLRLQKKHQKAMLQAAKEKREEEKRAKEEEEEGVLFGADAFDRTSIASIELQDTASSADVRVIDTRDEVPYDYSQVNDTRLDALEAKMSKLSSQLDLLLTRMDNK